MTFILCTYQRKLRNSGAQLSSTKKREQPSEQKWTQMDHGQDFDFRTGCREFKFARIGHVRYINILTWLRGFQVKPLYLVLFSLHLSLLGIEGQRKLEKFAILTRKPRSYARILIYRTWPINLEVFSQIRLHRLESILALP